MANANHNNHIAEYIKKHKRGDGKSSNRKDRQQSSLLSTGQSSKPIHSSLKGPNTNQSQPGASTSRMQPRISRHGNTKKANVYTFNGNPTFANFPDELVLTIFRYLQPHNLMIASCVCKRWLHLTHDKFLWDKIHSIYIPVPKTTNKNSTHHTSRSVEEVKKLCIKACVESRNKKIAGMLKKKHCFTGLPANTITTIKKSSISWSLCFIDSSSRETWISCSDVEHFNMASTVRWFSVNLPAITNISQFKIYAIVPAFFDKSGAAYKNCPHHRSLLHTMQFRWSELKSKHSICSTSDVLDVRILPNNLMIATFKDGGELAFITFSIHHKDILKKSLHGAKDRIYNSPRHRAKFDDIDTERGLHGYYCTATIRNHKATIWTQQFRELFCRKENIGGGHATLCLIRPENTFERSTVARKIQLPWKTDLFKGILPDLTILDLTLRDEDSSVFWGVSTPVNIRINPDACVLYDYDGDTWVIKYTDDIGEVHIQMIWEPDDKQYMMIGFHINIKLQSINNWFDTKY